MAHADNRLSANGFASIAAVCKFTDKSRPTIYRWSREGFFPKPVKIGPNSSAWRIADLHTWAADPAAWRAAQ